jgi:choline dehydrogenase-like flavoprotein
MTEVADYIVVGGGIGGCVVASRLKQRLPDASVVLIEAGPDASDHPLVADAANAQKIRASELNWNYPSVPQRHLNDRVCYNAAGKALGGGSVINSGKLLLRDRPHTCFSSHG